MTNDKELRELDEMRSLDRWIAQHVMHWKHPRFADSFNACPNYSTSPAAAMEVLKKIHEKACVTTWSNSHFHFCQLGTGEDLVKAQTLELAICRFARRLFGQEDK